MTKLNAGKASVLALSATLVIASSLLFNSVTSTFADNGPKINICHAKPADTAANGWVSISVSEKAIVTGTSKHATEHDADIIPSFTFDFDGGGTYPGKNWTTEGQAVYRNGCTAPESTPVPTPTPGTEVSGCTDEEATNYNPNATIDDDSCVYPTATPTDNGDVCDNIDGIQTGVPEGLHLDASGLNCVAFSDSNPPETSAPQGQVLGASTLAATGSFAENLNLALMALGGVLTAFGVRSAKKAQA